MTQMMELPNQFIKIYCKYDLSAYEHRGKHEHEKEMEDIKRPKWNFQRLKKKKVRGDEEYMRH